MVSRREPRFGNPVAIENPVLSSCADALAGGDDAAEVEGVAAVDELIGGLAGLVTVLAQELDGIGQRKLFAAKTIDEAAAANFSACFEATVAAQQVAPWREVLFLFEEFAKDDAVAVKQCPGDMLQPGLWINGVLRLG